MPYNKRVPTLSDFYSIYLLQNVLETGNLKVTITGWRNKDKALNRFNDFISIYYTENGQVRFEVFEATTLPGRYWLVEKLLSPKGTAILVPGAYKYRLGYHRCKYQALVQLGPVAVYRDGNKDEVVTLDPSTKESGYFGLNIHRAGGEPLIGRNSAGCQVFKYSADFSKLMFRCSQHAALWGNNFTYTLVDY